MSPATEGQGPFDPAPITTSELRKLVAERIRQRTDTTNFIDFAEYVLLMATVACVFAAVFVCFFEKQFGPGRFVIAGGCVAFAVVFYAWRVHLNISGDIVRELRNSVDLQAAELFSTDRDS